MRWFNDGDQIVIVQDDFIDLQESPAVFVPADDGVGQAIQHGGIRAMSVGALLEVYKLLQSGGGELCWDEE